jgi:putative DNA primase/helicase
VSSRRAPCPQCNRGSRDTALSITTDERGTVSHCFRCGYVATENLVKAISSVRPARSYRAWSETLAASLWRDSEPLHGSLAETYLLSRGCRIPPSDADLRFLAARGTYPPSMLARITDAITGEPISLHFTRLAADGRGKAGTDRDKMLLKGHRKAGGVIRLWPDCTVTAGLAVAEGIESALAAAHVFTPVWACIDAGNLSAFPVLPGIECLTVFADHDDAGLKAAHTCARRWANHGREAYVITASEAGLDCADLVAA